MSIEKARKGDLPPRPPQQQQLNPPKLAIFPESRDKETILEGCKREKQDEQHGSRARKKCSEILGVFPAWGNLMNL